MAKTLRLLSVKGSNSMYDISAREDWFLVCGSEVVAGPVSSPPLGLPHSPVSSLVVTTHYCSHSLSLSLSLSHSHSLVERVSNASFKLYNRNLADELLAATAAAPTLH